MWPVLNNFFVIFIRESILIWLLQSDRIGADEEIDDTKGRTMEEIQEAIEEKEMKAGTQILEMVCTQFCCIVHCICRGKINGFNPLNRTNDMLVNYPNWTPFFNSISSLGEFCFSTSSAFCTWSIPYFSLPVTLFYLSYVKRS